MNPINSIHSIGSSTIFSSSTFEMSWSDEGNDNRNRINKVNEDDSNFDEVIFFISTKECLDHLISYH